MTERARFWSRLLAEWERSGLSQAEFARRRGVQAVSFSWWKRKLRVAKGQRRHQETEKGSEAIRLPLTAEQAGHAGQCGAVASFASHPPAPNSLPDPDYSPRRC